MIIDGHAHVYDNPRINYSKDDGPFMSAEQQIEIMDRDGIDMTVIQPLCNPEVYVESQSISEVLNICEKYPGRFIPFCNVDHRIIGSLITVDVDYFEFVLNQYKELGCKGFGELCCKVSWDEPRLMQLLEACQRVGFFGYFSYVDPRQ